MNTSRNRFSADVIIVGAGVVGGTLAGLLAAEGLQCLLVEGRVHRAMQERPDPRALAITHASTHILRAAGVWKHLPPDQIGLFRKMQVWDACGDGDIEFDSAELCEATLGYIIGQAVLEQAVAQARENSGAIQCLQPALAAALTVTGPAATLTLADGRQFMARLIVGADGARSHVRELAGIACPACDYHRQAVACVVETEDAHDSIARQRFLPEGPLAFLPMADTHTSGIVWSTTSRQAAELLAMHEHEFNRALAEAFDHRLGAIRQSGRRTAFPLLHAHAEHYCLPRIALVGDAAHVVHPLAGQGANLGLLDAAVLAETITVAWKSNRDIGALGVLRRYERCRRGENLLMLKTMQAFKDLFTSRLPAIRHLRNAGLDVVDMLAPLKHTIMCRASGLSGDLPRVACGSGK